MQSLQGTKRAVRKGNMSEALRCNGVRRFGLQGVMGLNRIDRAVPCSLLNQDNVLTVCSHEEAF